MEEFALYLFKSVIWLTGFTLVFIFFLRNERFFLLNRIYLIAGILASFILPLISIRYTVVLPAVPGYQIGSSVNSANQIVQNSLIPDIKTILSSLYFAGVGIVVLLALRQGRSVIRAIKKSEVISLHPGKLIKTPEYTSAFTFFSYVFVNPSVTDVETKEIMIHELVHIRQKHWFDLLLVELLRTMQWFNPLVWIYVRYIRQNHEYLADEVALQQTSDPAVYKAVLLNQIVGAPVISLTNSFSYSPNKKRFYMMKNIITSPYRKMKVLLILPVFAFVLFAFAKPEYKYADQHQSSVIASDTTKQKSKWVAPPPLPPVEPAGIDNKNVPTPPPVINENQPLPAPPPPPTLSIKTDGADPLYILDGEVVSSTEVEKVDPESIESINVLKDKSARDKYGKKGKNGVIEITLKKSDKEFENAAFPKQAPAPQGNLDIRREIAKGVEIRSENDVKPLIVVDGVVKDIEVEAVDPDKIESISVLKDKDATDKYGEKAKDGAIEITLKNKP
jgi:hypothetical protein